jgi:hypothetical protein
LFLNERLDYTDMDQQSADVTGLADPFAARCTATVERSVAVGR